MDENKEKNNNMLKPCPFCGGHSYRRVSPVKTNRGPLSLNYVFCSECGAETRGFQTRDGADKAWNKRGEKQ